MSRENQIHRTMRLMTCCAFNRINAHLLNGYSFRYIFHFLFLIWVYKLIALTSSDNVGREIFLNFPPLIQHPISFHKSNLLLNRTTFIIAMKTYVRISNIHNNDILRINWYPISDFFLPFYTIHSQYALFTLCVIFHSREMSIIIIL